MLLLSACGWDTTGPTGLDDCVWDIWNGCSGNSGQPWFPPPPTVLSVAVTAPETAGAATLQVGDSADVDTGLPPYASHPQTFNTTSEFTLEQVGGGPRFVRLADLPAGCAATPNPQFVTVVAGQRREVAFQLTCS